MCQIGHAHTGMLQSSQRFSGLMYYSTGELGGVVNYWQYSTINSPFVFLYRGAKVNDLRENNLQWSLQWSDKYGDVRLRDGVRLRFIFSHSYRLALVSFNYGLNVAVPNVVHPPLPAPLSPLSPLRTFYRVLPYWWISADGFSTSYETMSGTCPSQDYARIYKTRSYFVTFNISLGENVGPSFLCESEKKIAFSASTACRESSLLTTWGLPSSQALFAQPTETYPIPCDTTWVLVVIDYSYLHEVASNLIPVEQSIWFLQVQRHFLGSQNLDKFDGYVNLYRGHSQMTSAERGRGKVPKFWCSKGGCVILVLQICPKCWSRGRGSKIQKI